MKTIYLVKKNPEVQGDQNNWITMNSYEFAMFMKTEEGKRRRAFFGEMDAVDEHDYRIVMECDAASARELKREKDRATYLRRVEIESGICTFSVDEQRLYDDRKEEEVSLVDPSADVEGDCVKKQEMEELVKALSKLNREEFDLIQHMFLNEKCLNGEQYAKMLGVSRKTVNEKKKAILRLLRAYLQ